MNSVVAQRLFQKPQPWQRLALALEENRQRARLTGQARDQVPVVPRKWGTLPLFLCAASGLWPFTNTGMAVRL